MMQRRDLDLTQPIAHVEDRHELFERGPHPRLTAIDDEGATPLHQRPNLALIILPEAHPFGCGQGRLQPTEDGRATRRLGSRA